MLDDVEVRWSAANLRAVGFSSTNAARLERRLPAVGARAIAAAVAESETNRSHGYCAEPVASVLWVTHNITMHQAKRLAHCGRGLLDLIVILDAVQKRPRRLSIDGMDIAVDWAIERQVPRPRLAYYIDLGFTAENAAAVERAPEPWSAEAVAALGALLRPNPDGGW